MSDIYLITNVKNVNSHSPYCDGDILAIALIEFYLCIFGATLFCKHLGLSFYTLR